jgi:hypothetical protein
VRLIASLFPEKIPEGTVDLICAKSPSEVIDFVLKIASELGIFQFITRDSIEKVRTPQKRRISRENNKI